MNVVVFGAGYVGLVTGTVLAYVGHDVTLIDIDEDKITAINRGQSPIYEMGLESLVSQMTRAHRLRATATAHSAVSQADAIFIAVGTPPLPSGASDLSSVEATAKVIGTSLRLSHQQPVIINKATVPIGSTNLVAQWVAEASNNQLVDGKHYAVVSNPEFLREGRAVYDCFYPDRIVIGTQVPWAKERLLTLYQPIVDREFVWSEEGPTDCSMEAPVPTVVVDPVSSEMIKYAANAFLAMKISFANEMATLCERIGADVIAVTQGIGLDPRIGAQFLNAGIGWGGSCFGKDVSSLVYTAQEYGYDPLLLQATQRVNERQRQRVVYHVLDLLKPVKGRKVAIWGLAYKPGTDDVRDSPARTVIHELLRLGIRVTASDPVAIGNFSRLNPELDVDYFDDPVEAARGADAVILITEWPLFRSIALRAVTEVLRHCVLIDGRNAIDPIEALQAGLIYRGVGRVERTEILVLRD